MSIPPKFSNRYIFHGKFRLQIKEKIKRFLSASVGGLFKHKERSMPGILTHYLVFKIPHLKIS